MACVAVVISPLIKRTSALSTFLQISSLQQEGCSWSPHPARPDGSIVYPKHTLAMTNKVGPQIKSSLRRPSNRNGLFLAAALLTLTFSGKAATALDEGAVPEVDQQTILRTTPTPFGGGSGIKAKEEAATDVGLGSPLSLTRRSSRLSLADRLVPSRLYLPGRMVLGKVAEFTIKGKPGSSVAIAMADRNTGAKPINGNPIRLGPDRKVVAIGKIPESGVLTLTVETPVQGDLIGQFLYFEAALWTKEDMSDAQIASTVTSETEGAPGNGVVIAQEVTHKRGIHIVPDAAVPLTQRSQGLGINSSP